MLRREGLYAAEDIAAGVPLLDYAGKVSVTVGDEYDTNKSSYLLNIFKDEDAGVYVDIDAARCGNEGRFVNDFHGTGATRPNAQFWPYFDTTTGEKRMAIKTIRPLQTARRFWSIMEVRTSKRTRRMTVICTTATRSLRWRRSQGQKEALRQGERRRGEEEGKEVK